MTKKKVKLPNHIHKFKRVDISADPKKEYIVFACQQPACSTYYTKILIEGKLCECWRCGDPFIIDRISATHAKPHCSTCIKRRAKPEIADLADLIEKI